MLERKKKLCKCGCGQMGYIWSQGCIKGHGEAKPTRIPKVTGGQKIKIGARQKYYQEAIQAFRLKYGAVSCEECGVNIPLPSGRNVSHILAGSNAPEHYLHPLNHKILCSVCEQVWTNGNRKEMRIWPECELLMQQIRTGIV